MAYEVTATRRRPQNFDNLVGQEFVAETLKNSIQSKKIAHAYLFSGPRGCGKTSTAMIPGEQIVGDDIAYFRNINGEFRAVNVEFGMFGIIKDVNAKDDPLIFENLMKNQEVIFSNVLQGPDKKPYWLGMGVEAPAEGKNHFGKWKKGMKDDKGNEEIGRAHV